jgi:hypothetical protein
MSGRRWARWVGPPVALAAAVLLLSRSQPGAEAGGRVTPRPAGVCADVAPVVRGREPARGAWWRIVDRLDANGSLAGRTLFAGVGGATNLTLELAPESSASGPVGGLVTVTSDDGRFSDVHLVSAVEGCSWQLHRSQDVVRSAILDRGDGSVIAHLVTRETRVDKGTWRLSGMDPDASLALILAPLAPQADLGLIWATELQLDKGGKHLAVQSCGETGCLTRIVTLDGRAAVARVGGAEQGSLVGLAGDRVVTWAHCQGLPCSLQAWRPGAARPHTLVDLAAGATITGDDRYLLAVLDEAGRATRMDLAGGSAKRIEGIAAGELPVAVGADAYSGFEVGADEVALSALNADPHAFNPSQAAAAP